MFLGVCNPNFSPGLGQFAWGPQNTHHGSRWFTFWRWWCCNIIQYSDRGKWIRSYTKANHYPWYPLILQYLQYTDLVLLLNLHSLLHIPVFTIDFLGQTNPTLLLPMTTEFKSLNRKMHGFFLKMTSLASTLASHFGPWLVPSPLPEKKNNWSHHIW